MTFFDLSTDVGAFRVSPWIWIYFLATILLTGVIQTSWALLSKVKERKLP